MKKAKNTLKRGFSLLCALLCLLPALSGVALASHLPVATAVPLGSIHDAASAIKAVDAQAGAMIDAAKNKERPLTAGDARYLSLYAEGALAQSAAEQVKGNELTLNAEIVNRVGSQLDPAEFERILNERMRSQGIEPFGEISVMAEFQMSTPDIVLYIQPDIVGVTSVDMILIKTPFYDLSFRPEDLESDLDETLTLNLRNVSETLEPRIEVQMSPRQNLAGFLTLSLPDTSGNLPEMAIVREVSQEEMEVVISSYNRVTEQINGKISIPGVYQTPSNGKSFERNFTDADRLQGLQLTAAQYVYGKGIMDGYDDRTFRPYAGVTRGQFVKIMMNSLTRDNKKKPQYSDVTPGMYYYPHAGYAQYHGYMLGFSDGAFHGERLLNKAQICRIMGRILVRTCKAGKNFPPSNSSAVISAHYDDAYAVPQDARDYVALLLNLEILHDSGRTFNKDITRIDVVEMLYRAFYNNYLR